jgi:large subunit ribosomal protein L9e
LLLQVELWFGTAKGLSTIRTVLSHVKNMMTGVTKGFRYTMRFVYRHFPINATIPDDGKSLEIRNFLGQKRVRYITMLEDTKINRSDDVKDQLVLQGNDIDAISRTCALIHQV